MQPVEAFKPLGILSISAAWLALAILINKWPSDRSMSFSRHAAAHKHAYFMMAIFQSVDLPLFVLFIYYWFVPTLNLSFIFTVLTILAAAGLLTAAWIPDKEGIKNKIHGFCAYGAAFLFIPAALIMALSNNISPAARIVSLLAAIYMIIIFGLFLFVPKTRNYHLYLQASYIMSFHAAILITTYLR